MKSASGPVLVTGADGFVGGYLVAQLESDGLQVVRAVHRPDRHAHVVLDICEAGAVAAAIAELQPSAIVNLAGMADPGDAEREPERAFQVNLFGPLHLAQALRRHAPEARLVVVGSAHVYGPANDEGMVREDAPLRPTSLYGVTKAAADLLALQQFSDAGLDTVRLRLFNTIGPGRQEAYFPGRQVKHLAEILEGRTPPTIQTLSLDGARDFLDVRDTANAISHALRKGKSGAAYNVGSSVATPLRTVIERLIALAGRSIEIREQSIKGSGRSAYSMAGDTTALRADTGWSPRYTLDDSLRDALAHARAALQ